LTSTVGQDNVQAKFKDGILDITVPKAEKRGGTKITIHQMEGFGWKMIMIWSAKGYAIL
jgi:hypothetical protein